MKNLKNRLPKNSSPKLEQFLLWFLDQPELPVETKQAFVEHLLEVRCFDEVAQKYVAIIMEALTLISSEKAEQAKKNLEYIRTALRQEKDANTSLAGHIFSSAMNKMKQLADTFVHALKTYEKPALLHSEVVETRINSTLKKNFYQ